MGNDPERFKGTPCLNCGCLVEGKFCSCCGQRAADLKQTLWGLMTEYLEHGLSLDSNFARTLISMLARPGELTVDYLSGRRARYFSPVRLYLLMSLFFFWSLTLSGAMGINLDLDEEQEQPAEISDLGRKIEEVMARSGLDVDVETSGSGVVMLSRSATEAAADASGNLQSAPSDSSTSFWERVGKKLESSGEKASDNPEQFLKQTMGAMSKAMFLLLPIFALLVRVLNFRRKMTYLSYLVFALHIHAVYFMIAMVFNIATHFFDALENPLQTLLIFLFPVYIIVAMRRAFGGTWLRSWAKVAFLVPAYGFCLGLGVGMVAVLQLLRIE